MKSQTSIVHECHNGAICTTHEVEGRSALPCSGGQPIYLFPTTEFGQDLLVLTHEFEAYLITQALKRGNRLIMNAAKLLRIKRQTLYYMLEGRHKDLMHLVDPAPRGRNSLAKPQKELGSPAEG